MVTGKGAMAFTDINAARDTAELIDGDDTFPEGAVDTIRDLIRDAEALDMVANYLSACECDSDILLAVAEVIHRTGRTVEDN
jgi:hypothetical protein